MAFDDRGGRRTIGAREIALNLWADKKQAERDALTRAQGEVQNVMLDGDYVSAFKAAGLKPPTSNYIRMRRATVNAIYEKQKRGEGNTALIIRLIQEGDLVDED